MCSLPILATVRHKVHSSPRGSGRHLPGGDIVVSQERRDWGDDDTAKHDVSKQLLSVRYDSQQRCR